MEIIFWSRHYNIVYIVYSVQKAFYKGSLKIRQKTVEIINTKVASRAQSYFISLSSLQSKRTCSNKVPFLNRGLNAGKPLSLGWIIFRQVDWHVKSGTPEEVLILWPSKTSFTSAPPPSSSCSCPVYRLLFFHGIILFPLCPHALSVMPT